MLNLSKFSLVVFICRSSQAHAVVAPLLAAVIANNPDAFSFRNSTRYYNR